MSGGDKAVVLDLSAKAEITGNIPDHAMGRMAHALSDALSPFTEGLGLAGDAIRAHRTLQVIKIAANARKLLSDAGHTISGAPLKFIAPWAEAASLEEEVSDLNIMWEHLLANASCAYESRYNNYVDILKSMSGDEARLLNKLCRFGLIDVTFEIERQWLDHVKGDLKIALEGLNDHEYIHHNVEDDRVSHIQPSDHSSIFEHDWNNARMVALFSYPTFARNISNDIVPTNGMVYLYAPGITEDIFSHQNLIRQGLLYRETTQVEIDRHGGSFTCTVWFLQATEIGIDLVRTCSTLKGPIAARVV